jgi:hypothetical protein
MEKAHMWFKMVAISEESGLGKTLGSGRCFLRAPSILVTFDFSMQWWYLSIYSIILYIFVHTWKVSLLKISQSNIKLKGRVITKEQRTWLWSTTDRILNLSIYTLKSCDLDCVTTAQTCLCSTAALTLPVSCHMYLFHVVIRKELRRVFDIWQTCCLWLSHADIAKCLLFCFLFFTNHRCHVLDSAPLTG